MKSFILKVCTACLLLTLVAGMSLLVPSFFCPDKNPCQPPSSHLICTSYQIDKTNGVAHVIRGEDCVYIPDEPNMTEKTIEDIMEYLNGLRREVASGKAMGAPGAGGVRTPLPRAYGMNRLEWADILWQMAGMSGLQCRANHDEQRCAATDQFPNVTFWYVAIRRIEITKTNSSSYNIPDLNESFLPKTKDALAGSQATVKPADITECPKLTMQTTLRDNRFLKIIQGGATHVGCAFVEFKTRFNTSHLSAHGNLMCYIAASTQEKTPVYNTTPPRYGSGFSHKCGCHPYFVEESGCLCSAYNPITKSTPPFFYQPKYLHKVMRGPTEPAGGFTQREHDGN